MEGEALFIPVLDLLQTLYPGAYTRCATSTQEGAELQNLDVKLSARTHPGAAGINSFLGRGDPSPTRPSSLVGATIDSLPVTLKSWLDRGSAYGGQDKKYLSTLAGAGRTSEQVEVREGVGVTENPLPPDP